MSEVDLRQMLMGPMTPLTLGVGWSDFGSPFETNGARLVGATVFLKGTIKSSGPMGQGSLLFTLPAALAPKNQRILMVYGEATNKGWVRIDVYPDGTAKLILAASTLPDTFGVLSLDDVSFGL